MKCSNNLVRSTAALCIRSICLGSLYPSGEEIYSHPLTGFTVKPTKPARQRLTKRKDTMYRPSSSSSDSEEEWSPEKEAQAMRPKRRSAAVTKLPFGNKEKVQIMQSISTQVVSVDTV